MRDKQCSIGFGYWNANICKRHKTQHQEEPAVLDAINKIAFFKVINEMALNFVLVYHEDAIFAVSIKDYVIIFNKEIL